jgi:hypothetical protein
MSQRADAPDLVPLPRPPTIFTTAIAPIAWIVRQQLSSTDGLDSTFEDTLYRMGNLIIESATTGAAV